MFRLFTFAFLISVFAPAFAATGVAEIQQRWAIANYQLSGDDAESAFRELITVADATVAAHPDDAELLIWQGIVKSTAAGKLGGFAALRLVKEARLALEMALELDEMAMKGSAYTSLGALYYQVPGWPIAFGSDKKARQLLEKALAINPDGIDSNYFYADFLVKEKEYARARSALQKALAAPARPGREIADDGRRGEIADLMATIDSQLNS